MALEVTSLILEKAGIFEKVNIAFESHFRHWKFLFCAHCRLEKTNPSSKYESEAKEGVFSWSLSGDFFFSAFCVFFFVKVSCASQPLRLS
jgi:hypothetical protein